MKILSLGAGVNSTAILALKALGKVDFEYVVFANTGGEHPETYQYIEEVIKPFCNTQKIMFVQINREGLPLYEHYFQEKIIPTRMHRHCTDKYKIRPLKKWAIRTFPEQEVKFIIGFCKGEESRAEKYCMKEVAEFPLIDLGLDRDDCKEVIKQAGLPVPIKSGCYFCPFTRVHAWKWLKRKHPDLFAKAQALEQNCSRYPELTLHQGATLEKVVSKTEMCDWLGDACAMCEVE